MIRSKRGKRKSGSGGMVDRGWLPLQVFLTIREKQALRREAKRTGRTMASLIRKTLTDRLRQIVTPCGVVTGFPPSPKEGE